MKKMKKKIDERRAKYSFAKGGEIKFGKWTLFRLKRISLSRCDEI